MSSGIINILSRVEDLEHPRDLGYTLEGEDFNCLPSRFVKFSNCLGMPIASFEKEICSPVRRLDSRKGRGVRVLGGKKRSSSCFKREI